ncbi:unnamed protein product [Paramecium sonneborni]|uniref:Tubulin-tyrosine ligase family protein n=1 Tax=Paramecium sonneborni TaxID=65129 RepID=A0A8S1RAL9_9CILI|nr:unnamed protein product [Paramecium sonneborni]
MIFQLRYKSKFSESLNETKDLYSMQNPKQNVPQTQRIDYTNNIQTNKLLPNHSEDILLCLVSKAIVTNNKNQIKNLLRNQTFSNNKGLYPEIKEEHPFYNQKHGLNYSEIEKQSKNILPSLQIISKKPIIRIQCTQKELNDLYSSKSSKLITPRIQKNSNLQSLAQQPENDKICRTSSTPFIYKNLQNQNFTNRSDSSKQRSKSKSQKTQKQTIQNPKQNQERERKQLQNHNKVSEIQQSKSNMIDLQDKKLQLKNKKRLTQTIQQQFNITIKQDFQQNNFSKQQNLSFPNNRSNHLKDKLQQRYTQYRCFLNKINFSNNQSIQSPQKMEIPAYYFFVGKGNNSSLIKNLFRQRWWWQEVETIDLAKVNMVWTQLKQNICIESLIAFNVVSSDLNYNNESFIQNIEDTVTDSSNSDLEINIIHRQIPLLNIAQQVKQPQYQINNLNQLKKLFNLIDLQKILGYMKNNNKCESQLVFSDYSEKLLLDIKGFHTQTKIESRNNKMHNHMQDNWHLGNKKALFYNMRNYMKIIKEEYTKYIPRTFHIQQGITDPEYIKFIDYYNKRQEEMKEQEKKLQMNYKRDKKIRPISLWIVKPGECSNRGNGITVCQDLLDINKFIMEEQPDGRQRTYIIQQYIDNPFLYNKRKFDIRCYMLLTSQNGILKGYWYQEGYIRTSSKEFTTKLQSKDEDYGKFEQGNKISFLEYQRYLDIFYKDQKLNFFIDIYPKMKQIALDLMKASYGKIDQQRRSNSFELFGLDFMIDDNFKLWLIEANTNPCLELSCPLLSKIIPTLIENLFRIVIDPIFPPPFFEEWPLNKKVFIPDNILENNRFELLFDEQIDKKIMINLYRENKIDQDCFKIKEEEEEDEVKD